jgi:hypothetical protein
VAEIQPFNNDSYAVLITEPLNILHAYELIEFGAAVGHAVVGASVSCWDPSKGVNINRNYTEPGSPSWSWYAEFVGFADGGMEYCDGRPLWEEGYCKREHSICYWAYTVVAELGTDLDLWCYVLEADCAADSKDLAIIGSHWLESGCEYPGWCGGADLNVSGVVDFIDFAILADEWPLRN